MNESQAPFDFFERVQARLDDLDEPKIYVVPAVEETPRGAAPDEGWTRSRLAAMSMAAVVAFLLLVSGTPDRAIKSDGATDDQPAMSIASVIPTAARPAIFDSARRSTMRGGTVRRVEKPVASEESEISEEWQIAEVQRHYVRPHPLIVQAALTLP